MTALRERLRALYDRKWARITIQVLIIAAVVLAVRAWQQREAVTGKAPPLAGVTLEGQPFTLAPGEGPMLVHFWASWCGVCNVMDGNVDALVDDHPMITVASYSGAPRDVSTHMKKRELSFPVLVDPKGALARRYGVTAMPTTFVIDDEGHIRHTEVGYTSELGLRARLWLARVF